MNALFNLLENIKNKPGLYLGRASISSLRMFIMGYRFSRSELGITNTESESDFYTNFQPWLQNRLSINTVNAWDKIILLTYNYLTCLALIVLTACTPANQTLSSQPLPEPTLQGTSLLPKDNSNILFPVLSKDKTQTRQNMGYIDRTGKIVIKHQFPFAYPFFEGIAVVRMSGKAGYIDQTGTFIIKPQFDRAEPFSEGMAAVQVNEKWGYINKKGEIVIPPKFDEVQEFSQGLAAVKIGENWGYIDKIGKIVIPLHFKKADSFSEGLAVVKISCSDSVTKIDCNDRIGGFDDGRYGFIDSSGNLAIKTTFFEASRFSEGLAAVSTFGASGYIDKSGKMAFKPQFHEAGNFSEGLAAVEVSGRWGYINKKGIMVIKLRFNEAWMFSEGLAVVGVFENNKTSYGYIDSQGNIAIQPRFDEPSSFRGGLAEVRIFGTEQDTYGNRIYSDRGYIDKTGKFVWNLFK